MNLSQQSKKAQSFEVSLGNLGIKGQQTIAKLLKMVTSLDSDIHEQIIHFNIFIKRHISDLEIHFRPKKSQLVRELLFDKFRRETLDSRRGDYLKVSLYQFEVGRGQTYDLRAIERLPKNIFLQNFLKKTFHRD